MVPVELRRCEGRYRTGGALRHGREIHRFLDVRVEGDQLVVESQTVSAPFVGGFIPSDDPRVERTTGESRPLRSGPAHTFDAIDFPRSYRFVMSGSGEAESVVVIRDGVESPPCPRVVPLPAEVPGRRERCEPLDLGHPQLCMNAKDLPAQKRFYTRLGFAFDPRVSFDPRPETSGVISQGRSVLAFLHWQSRPCINVRGPSIVETASELAKRGYAVASSAIEETHVRGDGTGSFMVYDPDDHRLFFDTNAEERPIYDAWKSGTLARGVGRHHEWNPEDVAEALPLGQLVVCLGVTDLAASTSFYRGMGFSTLEETPVSTTLFSRPPRPNLYSFPLRLRKAPKPSYSFGFLCPDVQGVAQEIRARGVALTTEDADGPSFVDPDGNRVSLLPVPLSMRDA